MNKIWSLILCLLLSLSLSAQLIIETGGPPQNAYAQWLVEKIFVGEGIEVSNVKFTGEFTTTNPTRFAIAKFKTGSVKTNLGIDSGIVMSTGKVTDVIGPNNSGKKTTEFGNVGDGDLESIINDITYDAAILEFDFIPISGKLEFKYVFGSEEYPEFVGTPYNDVFAFFVSGPNPNGPPHYNKRNIALVPGKQAVVNIANINEYTNNNFFVKQYKITGYDYNSKPIYEYTGNYVQFNGFTTVLTANIEVEPCSKYTMKIAIADVFDKKYDSGVFLQAQSFSSPSVSLVKKADTAITGIYLGDTAIEGCTRSKITLTFPAPVAMATQIKITEVGGTATPGVDYTPNLKDSIITFAKGEQSKTIYIDPIYDGIDEPVETIILTLEQSICSQTIIVIDTIYIKDYTKMNLTFSEDQFLCEGDSVQLNANITGGYPPYFYSWSTGAKKEKTTQMSDAITVSPTITTTYKITVFDACGKDTIVKSIVVNVGSAKINITKDTTICKNSTATLRAYEATNITWSTTPTQSSAVINVSPLTDTKYTITFTDKNGCSGTDEVTVKVNPLPVVTASLNETEICIGNPVTLSASGANTYIWTSTPASAINNVASQSITPLDNTTYKVTGTDNNGCTATASTSIIVDKGVTADFTKNKSQVCNPDTVTIQYTGNGTEASTYQWDFFGATVISGTGKGPYKLLLNNTGKQYVQLQVFDKGCPSLTKKDSIMVYDIPVANFSYTDTTSCPPVVNVKFEDKSTSTSAMNYQWAFNSGSPNTSTAQNPIIAYSNSGAYNVRLTVTSGICSAFKEKTINVVKYDNPTINVSPKNDTICVYEDIQLTASGAKTYMWSNSGSLDNGTIANPKANPTITTTYTVTGTDDNSCTNTNSLIVYVDNGPTTDFDVSINDTCQRSQVTITYKGNASNNATYNWNLDNADIISGTAKGPYIVKWDNTGLKTITLDITDRGCPNLVQTKKTVNIQPIPVVNFYATNTEGCPPAINVQFHDSTYNLGTTVIYSWTFGDGNVANVANPSNSYTAKNTYNVKLDVKSGKCIGTITKPIFVDMYANPDVAIGAKRTTVCVNEAVTLTPTGANTYLWTSTPIDPNLNANSNSPIVSPTVTTTYYVTGTDLSGCTNNANLKITVDPGPTSNFTISTNKACLFDTITIRYTGSGVEKDTFKWDFYDAIVLSGNGRGPYKLSWDTSGVKNITLTPVSQYGCYGKTATDSLTLYDVPRVFFYSNINEGCPPLVVEFTDTSQRLATPVSYYWDFGNGHTASSKKIVHVFTDSKLYDISLKVTSGVCSSTERKDSMIYVYPVPEARYFLNPQEVSIFSPSTIFMDESIKADDIKWILWNDSIVYDAIWNYTFSDTGKYNFSLVATNDLGCNDSTYGYVLVKPDYAIYAPNAFTPNGDGKNDVFKVYGVGIIEFNIQIFNRWGQIVFEADDIDMSWDGVSAVKGKLAPEALYMYKITFTNNLKKQKTLYGRVALIRRN